MTSDTNADTGIETDDDALITLIQEAEGGDRAAFDRLVAVVYPELKRLAHFQLAKERSSHTLSTTAIVHEAYERLAAQEGPWQDKAHFLRTAARIMRHLLIDYARRRNAEKRGSGLSPVTMDADQIQTPADQAALLQLEDALTTMAEVDPRLERVVECRLFAGLTVDETADALEMTVRTVERDWRRAKGYIHQAMSA